MVGGTQAEPPTSRFQLPIAHASVPSSLTTIRRSFLLGHVFIGGAALTRSRSHAGPLDNTGRSTRESRWPCTHAPGATSAARNIHNWPCDRPSGRARRRDRAAGQRAVDGGLGGVSGGPVDRHRKRGRRDVEATAAISGSPVRRPDAVGLGAPLLDRASPVSSARAV